MRWISTVLSFCLLCAGCAGCDGSRSADDVYAPFDAGDGSNDLSGSVPPDLLGQTPPDLFGQPPPDLNIPITGTVNAKGGGTVSRFLFGVSGDVRPLNCNETTDYPTAIIDGIFNRFKSAGVQFVVDTGDHMFVCQNGTQQMADDQMGLFTAATAAIAPKPTFLTLGNHDCVSMTNPSYCGVAGFTTPNYKAFLSALSPISALPYYSYDVQTNMGVARFVIIADNAWSQTQDTWLNTTLSDGEKLAYQFVFRHHPLDNTDMPAFARISQIIGMYGHTMVIVGHTHELRVDSFNDKTGRTLIVGNGGAQLTAGFTWYGYVTVEQLGNGNVKVSYFDEMTNNQMGTFTLTPK